MADFSLTTLFVVPKGVPIATAGSTQDLKPKGAVGFYGPKGGPPLVPYTVLVAADVKTAPYFQIAQARDNTYLQGTKRSDRIKGCDPAAAACDTNVIEAYKVTGCSTARVQITEISGWNVKCGDVITVTLRAHSSYLDTIAFNGWTRSVTVQAPCCDCGDSPCDPVTDIGALINLIIAKLNASTPGINPDNLKLSNFYTFENVTNTILRITAKPLTKYAQPCDVAAFPWEYDRMWFRTFVYAGPATTADFLVADNCNIVANAVITQRSTYPRGTGAEVQQLEKNFYSYQAGYLKHLYRMAGYNQNFDTFADAAATYDLYYVKFRELNKGEYQWGDYIEEDSTVIVAVDQTDSANLAIVEGVWANLPGYSALPAQACLTTTSTTSGSTTTTTSTTTLVP